MIQGKRKLTKNDVQSSRMMMSSSMTVLILLPTLTCFDSNIFSGYLRFLFGYNFVFVVKPISIALMKGVMIKENLLYASFYVKNRWSRFLKISLSSTLPDIFPPSFYLHLNFHPDSQFSPFLSVSLSLYLLLHFKY